MEMAILEDMDAPRGGMVRRGEPQGLPLTVAAFQKADRWLFGPLCFLLTRARRLRDFLGGSRPPREIRSILLVKLAEQGSTVLAISAIRKAVNRVGRENVWFVAFEENRFILDLLDLIPEKNVLTVSSTSVSAMFFGALRLLARLRSLRFDAAIDLEFMARFSAALTYLSGARVRVGMHSYFQDGPYRGDLMTHRVLFNPHLHTSELFCLLVEALDAPLEVFPALDLEVKGGNEPLPAFIPQPDEIAEVRHLLRSHVRDGSDHPSLILLNPNAGDFLPLRRWPLDRYQALARSLLERLPDTYVVFTGLPEEAARTEAFVQELKHDRCFSLAGKTSLRQLITLYTQARVLVTNDSGPAHFAVLTPIRVVTLFGPETPRLFAARTARNRVLYAGLPCSPCVNAFNNRQSACRNNLCLQAIPVEDVLAATLVAYAEGAEGAEGWTDGPP